MTKILIEREAGKLNQKWRKRPIFLNRIRGEIHFTNPAHILAETGYPFALIIDIVFSHKKQVILREDIICYEKPLRNHDNRKSIRLTIFIPFTLVTYVLSAVIIVFS